MIRRVLHRLSAWMTAYVTADLTRRGFTPDQVSMMLDHPLKFWWTRKMRP